MKAESIQNGKKRFYPCPKCKDNHPSITTLLDVIGSPALMGWMAKNGTSKLLHFKEFAGSLAKPETFEEVCMQAEQDWQLENGTAYWKSGKELGADAADIGTMCHAWIEAHLQGKEIDLAALPEKGQNALGGYLKWEKEHKLETIRSEQTFYNCKLNYAGTADWLGKLDGELSLGDWKTSTGIFFNYCIQGWGYALADETENAERLYRQIFIGRFGKDGSSEVKIFKRNEFPSIDDARDVITACGHIFARMQEWERLFPYRPKPKTKAAQPQKEKINEATTAH